MAVGFNLGLYGANSNSFMINNSNLPEAYGRIVFLAFCASGMLCLGLAFLFPTTIYKKNANSNEALSDIEPVSLNTSDLSPDRLNAAPAISSFEMPFEDFVHEKSEAPSVTEHTTRKLS